MSGNKWREPWQRDSAEDTYQSYYTDKSAKSKGGKGWGYWRGSWGSPRASHGQQERYDTVQLPQERPQPQPCLSLFAGDTTAPSAPPTMKEIQKYLTQAQRADTKLRKLREEQDKGSKQWAAYEQQMKQKFAKQRKLFEADLQRIAREANEAAEQGQLAAQRVKEVVNYGRVEAEDTMEEDNEAWDNLMRGEQDERLQDGFLKMALHATARQEASARLQGTSTAAVVRSSAEMGPDPFTRAGGPPTGAAHQGIGPPPGFVPHSRAGDQTDMDGSYMSCGPVDPYMASPSGAFQKRKLSTSPRVSPYETGRPSYADKVPEKTAANSGAGLEAKLAANRALQPFGLPPPPAAAPPEAPGDLSEHGTLMSGLVDDDDDELSQSQHAAKPGGKGPAG